VLACITLTHNVRFWTTFKINKAIYSRSSQRSTCGLNVCIGVTLINIKLPRSCYISRFHRRPTSFWRRCGLSGHLQMHFVTTNTGCPVFSTCYMCYLSSHTITPIHKSRLSTLPSSYVPIEYFNSQFQWTMVAKKIKMPSFFSNWCYCAQ
jgi:hypothetical protein